MTAMENQSQTTQSPVTAAEEIGARSATEIRQFAELMDTLSRDNRAMVADYLDALRLEREFSLRIGKRTTQIIRFSAAALVVIGGALMALILVLINHMSDITNRMDEMTTHIASMRGNFDQVSVAVQNMDQRMGILNGQMGQLTGQMNYMSRDLNTMSSPMRMMPFRP